MVIFLRSTLVLALCLLCSAASAEEFHLQNGDRVSGEVIAQDDDQITVKTEAMGTVTIARSFVKPEEPEAAPGAPAWKRSASLGYTQSGGNTDKSQGTATLKASRKTEEDEWSAKWNAYYSSADNQIDARKFYGMVRYAHSFGDDMKWYRFYKLEGDQDRFANIDYRVTPNFGVGYWFADEADYKAMTEVALGYEHTNYRGSADSDNEAILIPRGYLEKKIYKDLTFSQDFTFYPSLSEFGDYRFHSETELTNPISERVSWKLSFIDDYDSDPSGSTKKNDYRIVAGLEYNF